MKPRSVLGILVLNLLHLHSLVFRGAEMAISMALLVLFLFDAL